MGAVRSRRATHPPAVAREVRGVRFVVRLTPRGGLDHIEGAGPSGELRARVAAPPVDGAANRALVRMLARELGVAESSIELESGESDRTKRVRVDGTEPESVAARWAGVTVTSVSS